MYGSASRSRTGTTRIATKNKKRVADHDIMEQKTHTQVCFDYIFSRRLGFLIFFPSLQVVWRRTDSRMCPFRVHCCVRQRLAKQPSHCCVYQWCVGVCLCRVVCDQSLSHSEGDIGTENDCAVGCTHRRKDKSNENNTTTLITGMRKAECIASFSSDTQKGGLRWTTPLLLYLDMECSLPRLTPPVHTHGTCALLYGSVRQSRWGSRGKKSYLFTAHQPTPGWFQEVIKILRVERGRV